MNRFFLALVCAAMVFLGASTASATVYDCHISGIKRFSPLHEWVGAELDIVVDDSKLPDVEPPARKEAVYAYAQWTKAHPVGPIGERMIYWDKFRCTARASTPPVPKSQVAQKPKSKTWACRVKLKWQVGDRTGVHEGTYDIEAATEAAAMGRAIFEAQSHLKARTLAGTNPTWVKTDVKCS